MNILIDLIMALLGGIFGAYIGGLNSFVLCGLFGLIGIGIYMATGDASFINEIAFGPMFGPQVSFAGGVAAAAYLGKQSRKGLISESLKLDGTDIVTPIHQKENIGALLVGGVFGVVGQAITMLASNIDSFSMDAAAFAVVVAGMLARLFFTDSSLVGKDFSFKSRFKDLSFKEIILNAIPAYAVGVLIAKLVEITGVSTFGFLLGAFTLIFITMGVDFPMTHHIGMPAGFAYMVFENIWVAGIFGITGYLVAEVLRRIFNSNANSHIDHPAFSIFVHSLIFLNIK